MRDACVQPSTHSRNVCKLSCTHPHIAHAHIQEQAGPEAMKTAYDSDEDVFIACICAAISFVLYMMTLYPRVPGGDSGELIAAAYQVCC